MSLDNFFSKWLQTKLTKEEKRHFIDGYLKDIPADLHDILTPTLDTHADSSKLVSAQSRVRERDAARKERLRLIKKFKWPIGALFWSEHRINTQNYIERLKEEERKRNPKPWDANSDEETKE